MWLRLQRLAFLPLPILSGSIRRLAFDGRLAM